LDGPGRAIGSGVGAVVILNGPIIPSLSWMRFSQVPSKIPPRWSGSDGGALICQSMRMLPEYAIRYDRAKPCGAACGVTARSPCVIGRAYRQSLSTSAAMKCGSVRSAVRATLALLLRSILLHVGRSLFGVETARQPPVDRSSTGTDRSLHIRDDHINHTLVRWLQLNSAAQISIDGLDITMESVSANLNAHLGLTTLTKNRISLSPNFLQSRATITNMKAGEWV